MGCTIHPVMFLISLDLFQLDGDGGGEEKPGDLMCLGFCQTQIVSVVKQKREAGGEEGSLTTP